MATFQDWKEGDLAIRKNRLCRILRIHFDEYPPHVTIKMLDDGNEIGTEFSKLQHLKPEEIKSMEDSAGQTTIPSNETETNNDITVTNNNINNETTNAIETGNKNDDHENSNDNENESDNNNQDVSFNKSRNKSKTPQPSQATSRASNPRKHKEHLSTPITTSKNKPTHDPQNKRCRYFDDGWQNNNIFGRDFFEDFNFF